MKYGALVLFCAAISFFMVNSWFAEPFKGRVVDQYGNAVPGVVVVVAWGFHRGHSSPILIAQEGITDAKGIYEIPSWQKFAPLWFGQVDSIYLFFVKKNYSFSKAFLKSQEKEYRYFRDVTPSISDDIVIKMKSTHYVGDEDLSSFSLFCTVGYKADFSTAWASTPLFVAELKKFIENEPSKKLVCNF